MRVTFFNFFYKAATKILLVTLSLIVALCAYAAFDAYLANGESSSHKFDSYSNLEEAYQACRSANDEVVGWVKLFDSGLSQPIVQGEDNSYYLTHDVFKCDNVGGAAFLDYRDSDSYMKGIPVVYGHNMEHSSMFGSIKFYETEQYFTRHIRGCLRTKIGWHNLQACALLKCSENECFIYNCFQNEGCEKAIQSSLLYAICSVSDISSNDNLLALSTCTDSGLKRHILICKIGDIDSSLGRNKVN